MYPTLWKRTKGWELVVRKENAVQIARENLVFSGTTTSRQSWGSSVEATLTCWSPCRSGLVLECLRGRCCHE